MTFGDRIRSNRIKSNMNQQDLADLLNVTPQTISKWENDLSEPGFQMITKMTEIFKISHDVLFIGDNDITYKGSLYTAMKDSRMKKYYDFFVCFIAFISLVLLITTVYISTLEVLTWHFTFGFSLLSVLLLTSLFITSRWRNKFDRSPEKLLDLYQDKVIINEGNLTIYANKIKALKTSKYNFYTGIRIYENTGYLKIWTNDNQIVLVRDIYEIQDLKTVLNKMKNEINKEGNQ